MKKTVYVKGIPIGDGKVTIQSMTDTPTTDVGATLSRIIELAEAGADFVRISIPDEESAEAVKYLASKSPVPLIGDIHYTHIPALAAIENGIAKIRVNPSNMSPAALRTVAKKCAEYDIPVRVGVNKGSFKVPPTPLQMADAALDEAKRMEDAGWNKLVLSVKSSDPKETVEAYRILAKKCDYPLHIGLTEAGTVKTGAYKSVAVVGSLLLDGIGDTVRVSLTGNPVNEILVAKNILRAVGIDKNYVNVVSCPTCARTSIDVEKLASSIERATRNCRKPLTVAVMGCVVNGIGEGKTADFGVAGGKDKSVIFSGGKRLKVVNNADIEGELLKLLEEYLG